MSIDAVRDCHVPDHLAARRGYVRVGLDVSFESTSEREVPVNPFYASLRDASGEVYATALSGCDPALPPVRLVRGARARGHLNFDVARTATSLELRYAPPVLGRDDGQDVEELWFRLRR